MTWGVTPSDVQNTTGATVDASAVAQADAVVTIYANRTPSASGALSARDLYWVRSAIAWQAAWMVQQPNYVGRNQYDSLSQDGLSTQSTAEWAKVLAPLAARSLKNVSWKGSRTIRTPSAALPVGVAGLDFTMETSDPWSDWEPL